MNMKANGMNIYNFGSKCIMILQTEMQLAQLKVEKDDTLFRLTFWQ